MCGDLHMTRGEFDNAGSRYPEEKVRSLQDVRVVCGAFQTLTPGRELAVCPSSQYAWKEVKGGVLSAPCSKGRQLLTSVAYGACRCSAWAGLRLGSAMGTRYDRVL